MTLRHIVLSIAGVAVLGMGIYLFQEVRSTAAPSVATDSGPRVASSVPEPPELHDAAAAPSKNPTIPATATHGELHPIADQDLHLHATEAPPPPPPNVNDPPDDLKTKLKLDDLMSEANKAYDRGDFDDAKGIAQKALAKSPNNVRMLRILVSASCIDGDNEVAQKSYQLLPDADKAQMRTRCERYGVAFKDK